MNSNKESYNSRKLSVDEQFNYLVHFHSQFLRSFDELLLLYKKQHYGRYEDIPIQRNNQNEMVETMIKTEDTLQRIEERYKVNLGLEEIMSEMFVELDQMKQRLHLLLLECGKDNMYLVNKNEELINTLAFCQKLISERNSSDVTKSDEETLQKYRNTFNRVIENIMIPNLLHEYFVQKEVDQLKEWIGLRFETILFDSKFITLNTKNIFSKMIMNKRHLLFLIEDDQHNKFGGYLHALLDKPDTWIEDNSAFLFSITSNDRLHGMQRFSLPDPQHAFYLSSEINNPLVFLFGNQQEIQVNVLSQPSYSNLSFGFYPHVLTGQSDFNLTRLIVIELK